MLSRIEARFRNQQRSGHRLKDDRRQSEEEVREDRGSRCKQARLIIVVPSRPEEEGDAQARAEQDGRAKDVQGLDQEIAVDGRTQLSTPASSA